MTHFDDLTLSPSLSVSGVDQSWEDTLSFRLQFVRFAFESLAERGRSLLRRGFVIGALDTEARIQLSFHVLSRTAKNS